MDSTQQMILALQGQQQGMTGMPPQNGQVAMQNQPYQAGSQPVNPSAMPGSMGNSGDMYGGMFGAPPMTPPPQGIY